MGHGITFAALLSIPMAIGHHAVGDWRVQALMPIVARLTKHCRTLSDFYSKCHVLLLMQINYPYIVWKMFQSFIKIVPVVFELHVKVCA